MDFDFMALALEEARLAMDEGELPVGAVVVEDGRVIGRGHNAREALSDPTAHAEIMAIRDAAKNKGDWRLTGATLYVTLEPCPMCAGAISGARVSRLVYGARDPERGCAGSLYRIPEDAALGWFCRSEGGVMEEECQALITQFFTRARATKA